MSLLKSITLACVTLLPTTALADWNGWYAGASVGELSNGEFNAEGIPDADIEDASTFGGFFGRMTQNGNLAFGYEIALISADETQVNSLRDEVLETPIIDLKSRLGYPIGDVMPYGVLAVSVMGIDGPLTDVTGSGLSLGAGIEYKIADQFLIGVEYLARRTSGEAEQSNGFFDITRDVEVNADTVSLRVGFKF